MATMTISALRVLQPIGEFYISVMAADAFIDRVSYDPRTSDAASSDAIQRKLIKSRIRDIASYVCDVNATFPTPIILAVNSDRIIELDDTQAANLDICRFQLPTDGIIGSVLDGQHRIEGLKQADSRTRERFQLPIVLMFDLDPEERAYVFGTINSTQTPVSASLIYDLFELSKVRSPQKTCHLVARSMNENPSSALHRRIKMLGRKEPHHNSRVMLSQGAFASRLERLITSDAARDLRMIKSGEPLPEEADRPLRKYWIREEDHIIVRILENFFGAIRDVFPGQWNDDSGKYMIRKTVGLEAMMNVLKVILLEGQERKDLSERFFAEKARELRARLGDPETLTSEHFKSSSSEASRLARILLGHQ